MRYIRAHKFRFLLAFCLLLAGVLCVLALDDDGDGMDNAYETFFNVNYSTTNGYPALSATNSADGALDYDSDSLVNSNEFTANTDVFSSDTDQDGFLDGADDNPTSRVWLSLGSDFWLLSLTNDTYDIEYAQPTWLVSASKLDGVWETNPPSFFVASSNASDVGSISIEVNRSILTNDVVLALKVDDNSGASLYVRLYDTNINPVATNLYCSISNVLSGSNSTNVDLKLDLPLESYTSAAILGIERGSGEITIYSASVYIDKDGDGLDSDQEQQLGTSDQDSDSDSDGISDYDEVFTYNTDPVSADSDSDGMPDGWEATYSLSPTNAADASADADGDGLTNLQEYTAGTSPLLTDSDGDAVSDGAEFDLGRDPATSNTYHTLPFVDLFETNTVSIGELHGQNGWGVSATNVAAVQTNEVLNAESLQAVAMNVLGTEEASADIDQVFVSDESTVWVDLYIKASEAPRPDADDITGTAIDMFFDDDTKLVVFDGSQQGSNRWVTTQHDALQEGDWVRLTTCLDYNSKTWKVCVNGVLAAEDLSFADTNIQNLTSMGITGASANFDSVSVTTNQPSGTSIDGDRLADDWEELYFSDLDEVDSGDADGDGLTNLQEYQMGSDPSSSDTDGDGYSDGDEVAAGTDMFDALYYPLSISGTITYTGSQTGLVRIAAVSSGAQMDLTLTQPGQSTSYDFTNLISRTDYSISAFIDASGDGQSQVWEPIGAYTGNPIVNPTADVANVDFTLTEDQEIDTDGDGMTDYDEIYQYGSDPDTFTATPTNVTNLTHQVWTNIAGTTVSLLTSDSRYPYYPDQENELTPLFEAPVNSGYTFGQRIIGQFRAPRTGSYTFWLASDDYGELWVATNGTLQLVADVQGWTASREWDKFTSQQSTSLWLQAGELYPVEAIGKEGVGYDNLAVGIEFESGMIQRPVGARWFATPPSGLDLFADADSDGLNNYEEWALGTDSSLVDTDGDSLSDSAEVNTHQTDPLSADTDGDGMSDDWEIDNGLNPVLDDSTADADGDGLDNLGEYRAGTDPFDVDTDDDGLSDEFEVMVTLSDPLAADFNGTVTQELALDGADANAANGAWLKHDNDIESMGRRGAIAYTNIVTVSQDGIFRIEVEGKGFGVTYASLIAYVDGEYVGTQSLQPLTSNQTASVYFCSPWIKTGDHDLLLYWDNVLSGSKLTVSAVKLATLGGPDADSNGRADWIDNRLEVHNSVESASLSSKVSPACLQGKTTFVGLMTVSSGTAIKGASGGEWYTKVPLEAGVTTNVAVSFENDAVVVTSVIDWAEFNIITESDCQLSVGDSLLLMAAPTNATDGNVSISISGVTNYTTDIDTPVAHQFEASGDFTVIGVWSNSSSAVTNTITVSAVDASFSSNGIALWMGKKRTVTASGVPFSTTTIGSSYDTTVAGAVASGYGTKFDVTVPFGDGKRYLDVRLSDDTNAILDSVALDAFWVYHAVDRVYHHIETLADGTAILQDRLIAGHLPESVTLTLKIMAGGATFANGASQMNITSDDLNAQGEYIYKLIMPPGTSTPCHYILAYQDGIFIAHNL